MNRASHSAAARREALAAERVPYTVHVSPSVVATREGDFVQVFRLGGASFESADDESLNDWHERLNVLWRNIASPNVALWTHVIRRRETVAADRIRSEGFADLLARRYHRRIAGETLMVNELYLAVVYRPSVHAATTLAARALNRASTGDEKLALNDALDACEKLSQTICASLERYEPEVLSVYTHEGRWCSRILEYFSCLINADRRRVPLPRGPLSHALATVRLFFGVEAIEYRDVDRSRVGAILGIKEYPTPSIVGMLDPLLSAPFSFVLTQSFAFLSKGAGQGLLQRQHHRMTNAGDFALSQAEELHAALDALTSNEFAMGDHHFTLQVLADLEPDSSERGAHRLKALNDNVALARALLADTGMAVAREDLALEGAFWAQLPGHFSMRPRKAPITSRNLSAMVPFHNFPTGRPTGNYWGDALALLVTSARSPYYFSLHASDPNDPDGGSRKDVGHTRICGPTGSGKTVFIGFLIAMLWRRGVTQVVFDKDRGLQILIRALRGTYLPLLPGEGTGFNPLQLPSTAVNYEFQKALLRMLVRAETPLSAREQNDLDQALRGTLALDPPARRLSRLIEFTDATRPDGIHARLAPWCHSTGGDYAWVFDNDADVVAPRLNSTALCGFDLTHVLDHPVLRGPINKYLLHITSQLLDGRQLVCWLDEFSKAINDPDFQDFADNGPKTWRKLNGVLVFAAQVAREVIDSEISRTLIEQTPTEIYFPNPDADRRDYVEGFGLTEREFLLVKQELSPGSRMFLVRQGHYSIVCQLDLKGFDGELAVISGRAHESARLHKILAETGDDPAIWLPFFHPSLRED